MKKIVLVVVFMIALTAHSQEKRLWAKSVIDQKAPKLSVEQWLSKKPNTKGKFVLIDFWATWCGPCKRAIPELNHFQKEFVNDLVVIGISDEPKELVEKMTVPKMEYYSAIDTYKSMNDVLEVKGIPHCILIDPNGIVRWEGWPQQAGYELTSSVIKGIIEKYR
ncbi:TlpA disulfide reductase family protein [Flavobacterium sp. NG2]|uniref:TlpA family protein disulfide reductase n=1 Tax=Flavobacterium sp. NG2 TaxID=3097547 RepID=UPI002A802AF6|nr:TlpA disulfide reductase family protein [Flavobacterium sp. NG2]WPR70619.1 TlpA disulfide reductase family protein [Flavobacterium sp. NG2]